MRTLLTCVLFVASSLGHAASVFEFHPAPGPLPVGFRVVQQYDHSRVFLGDVDPVTGRATKGERARPVQTLVWYPAAGSGKAMRYGDYLELIGTELDFTLGKDAAKAAASVVIQEEYIAESGPEQARQVLDGPMRARRDAPAQAGKFPVLIYVPSISAPAGENADLCEYLASHGYIVIASPSVGPRSRTMPNDLEGAQTGADDIAFLIAYAHTLPHADPGRIGVAGFSWGGISNVFASARDSRIKALVNLDGSVRYYPDLIAEAKYVTPERVTAPMLYAAARPASREDFAKTGKPVHSFLNELKYADFHKLTMYPMEHFAFSSTYLRFASDIRFNQYPRSEVNRAYGWTATYVKHFLDAYLKGDSAARAYLAAAPATHGIPAHAATMESRPAAPRPSRERLAAELARRGFQDAHAAYLAIYGKDKAPGLSETELAAWGFALMRTGDVKPAIAIFRLITELYPLSANAFDALASAFERDGDKAQAIFNYRQALRLDPDSEHPRTQLKALEAAASKGASPAAADKAS
jgi:dienelactone hydrolase